MSEEAAADLDSTILARGRELWARIERERPRVVERRYWEEKMLEWVMRDPAFKTDLFHFVDVLASLDGDEAIAAHVREYLLRPGRELPLPLEAAFRAAAGTVTSRVASKVIRRNVEELARRFIVGRNAREASRMLEKLHRAGIAFTVDLLGEKTMSDAEADVYAQRYVDLIDELSIEAARYPADPVLDRNHLGRIPRVNVSIKLSAMDPHLDPVDCVGAVARLKERVLPLFRRAREKNVFVHVDLEEWALHEITLSLFEEVLAEPDLRGYPHVGIVVQAYLKSTERDLDRVLSLARARGAPITVRLVKGAYWDYETVLAAQQRWPSPVFATKPETDASYERATAKILANIDHLLPAFGSHNLRSVLHALTLAATKKIPREALEIQMLYGMAEAERKALRDLGHRVRVYAPVGDLLPGMAYLVRRLLENTSNEGFLRQSHHDRKTIDELLAPSRLRRTPANDPSASPEKPGDIRSPFANCPLTDFQVPARRERFARHVTSVRASFPRRVPVVIDGRERLEGASFERRSPNDSTIVVAEVMAASPALAREAAEAAMRAYPGFRDRPLAERASMLDTLGTLLEVDRDELSALQVWECGKPWREADADVAEAVDFCRYYARRALVELGPKRLGEVPGETNALVYEGRGPTVVIAPWNFPLAILTGMAGAALVAGNPVILKPAEQSSAVGHALYERMRRAGFPASVVQFLPGRGEEVGPVLVEHPAVATVAFTGSKAVGLEVVRAAAGVLPGQPQVRRVIAEMGGKNAIVVDDDADLDEAVSGIVKSAFGYAGQKCSAASRVIAVGGALAALRPRLVEAMRSLHVGGAEEPGTFVPPVIDAEARTRLLEVLREPGSGARLLFAGTVPTRGEFVPPALFEVKDPDHRLLREEFFGPIVALQGASTFDEALAMATKSEYALTGAVFSRLPSHLQKARAAFRVGNLYLNRGSTGAMVGRQAFGGFGMSGIGTKAGGPGYLLHFSDPRCVTENTLRRGFVPESDAAGATAGRGSGGRTEPES